MSRICTVAAVVGLAAFLLMGASPRASMAQSISSDEIDMGGSRSASVASGVVDLSRLDGGVVMGMMAYLRAREGVALAEAASPCPAASTPISLWLMWNEGLNLEREVFGVPRLPLVEARTLTLKYTHTVIF